MTLRCFYVSFVQHAIISRSNPVFLLLCLFSAVLFISCLSFSDVTFFHKSYIKANALQRVRVDHMWCFGGISLCNKTYLCKTTVSHGEHISRNTDFHLSTGSFMHRFRSLMRFFPSVWCVEWFYILHYPRAPAVLVYHIQSVLLLQSGTPAKYSQIQKWIDSHLRIYPTKMNL